MPAVDPAVIAAIVADNVHRPVDDGAVTRAVDSAIAYVGIYTALTARGMDVPDDALTVNGLVGLSERMFLDEFAPTGAMGAIGDDTFGNLFTGEDPYRRWHHNFDHLVGYTEADDDLETPAAGGWGIA
jgi:hypothetical protein